MYIHMKYYYYNECPVCYTKFSFLALAVIKKYYILLIKSFPKDHMISLGRYSSVYKLSDDTIDFIISADNSDQANRRLFGFMTYIVHPEQEDSLFTFCSNLEIVIGNHEMLNVIEQLRNG